MDNLDKQTTSSNSDIIKYWQRIPLLVRAIVSGLFVSTLGVYSWLVIGPLIPGPYY